MKQRKLSIDLIKYTSVFSISTFLVLGVIITYLSASSVQQENIKKTNEIINLIEKSVTHYLKHPVEEMRYISEQLNNGINTEIIESRFELISYIYRVDIVDEKGKVINAIPFLEDRINLDLSKSHVFKNIRFSNEEYVFGEMIIDSYTGSPTMYISHKLNDGYVIGYLNLEHFQELLSEVRVENGFLGIIDMSGTYISHTNQPKVKQQVIDPFSYKIRNDEVTSNTTVQYDGKPYRLSFKQIEGSYWYILAYQNYETVVQPIRHAIITNIIAFGSILIIFSLFIYRLAKRISNEAKNLEENTSAIAIGDYNIKDTAFTYLEFQELFNRVRYMSEKVEAREDEILSLNRELENNYYTTIVLLAKAIDAKDNYTGNHSVRVRDLSLDLAEELELTESEMTELKFGAILHDIGKISIPESVLNKPDRLTDEEFVLIKTHSQSGYGIVEELPAMNLAKQVILHHHERYDGKGYPYGLKGIEIPILARIVTIADSFDAMTTERPYRKAYMSTKDAFEELRRNAGVQFDPDLVEIFINKVKHGG